MIVDDNLSSARALAAFLTRTFAGRVTPVIHDDAAEALDYLRGVAGMGLCFVDLELGPFGMDGRALIERVVAARPELAARIVVTSGDPFAGLEPFPDGVRRLDKPLDLRELGAMVEEALARG